MPSIYTSDYQEGLTFRAERIKGAEERYSIIGDGQESWEKSAVHLSGLTRGEMKQLRDSIHDAIKC